MADSIDQPGPIVDRILSTHNMLSIDCLPPELVPEILGYLDQADLRCAAAVSRIFYDSAWRAGLYLHLNIRWHLFHCVPDRWGTVKDAVNPVLRKGLRFSVTANFQSYSDGARLQEAINSTMSHESLALMSSALPVLIYLSMSTAGNFFPAVAAALHQPAPNLAAFELSVYQVQEDPAVHRVPMDLFMGLAPNLRQLALQDVPLGRDPVPAFARVHTVSLDYTELYADIVFAAHFPHLRCLHLKFYTDAEAPPPSSFKLDGVRLRKLTLRDCFWSSLVPAILASTNFDNIAEVVLNVSVGDWRETLWRRAGDAPFSMYMTSTLSMEQQLFVVVPEHRRWRRAYNKDLCRIDVFPLHNLPAIAARLAYLRLENTHIAGLLECRGLVLGSLLALRVDFRVPRAQYATMVWPPDWLNRPSDGTTFSFTRRDASTPMFSGTSYSYIDCSMLERLTLFAMDAVLGVKSREIAFLGRALSQCARPKQARASLALVGVVLKEDDHPLLAEAFSAVYHHDFAGRESSAGRDAGLWDDDLD